MHSASAKSNASACNPVTSSVSSGSATSTARTATSPRTENRFETFTDTARQSSVETFLQQTIVAPLSRTPSSEQTTCFHQTQPSYRGRHACKAVPSVLVVEVVQLAAQQNAPRTENRFESFTDTARQISVETFLQQTVVAPLSRTPSFRTDDVLPPNTTLLQRTPCLQSRPQRPVVEVVQLATQQNAPRTENRFESFADTARQSSVERFSSKRSSRASHGRPDPDRRRASTKHNPLTEDDVPAKPSPATRRRGSPARHPAERPAHGESPRILHGHRKAELHRDVSPANGRRAPSHGRPDPDRRRASTKHNLSQRTTCLQNRPQRPIVEVVQLATQQNAPRTENRLESFTDTARQSSVETFLQQTVVARPLTDAQLRTDDVLPPNTTLLQRTPCLQSRPQRTRRRGSPLRQPAERPAHGESLRIPHEHRKAELRRDVPPANGRRAPLTDAQLRTDDVLPPNTTLLQRTPCLQSRPQRTVVEVVQLAAQRNALRKTRHKDRHVLHACSQIV